MIISGVIILATIVSALIYIRRLKNKSSLKYKEKNMNQSITSSVANNESNSNLD